MLIIVQCVVESWCQMSKKIKPGQHIINWDPKAHTLIRSSAEPYVIGPEYEPTKVSQSKERSAKSEA